MSEPIDLRSDTVTHPTPAMRAAMAAAEVGDDVWGDDPTVNWLEARCAERTGKAAAMFVPSGTMANLVCVRSWTQPGDEVLIEADAHTVQHEVAGAAAVAGVQFGLIRGRRGTFTADDVEPRIRCDDIHEPVTRLVCMENTHTLAAGAVFPLEAMRSVARLARPRGLRTHLDGARLWNACVASGTDVRDYAACVDSLCFCFSKGLGCPVGSIVCGPEDFMRRARKVRKMLGGGMRQAGVLAAAALYALDHHVDRLADDHARARRLAEALAGLPGVTIDPAGVETNLVVFEIAGAADEWIARFAAAGVLLCAYPGNHIRAALHLDIDDDALDRVIAAARRLLRSGS